MTSGSKAERVKQLENLLENKLKVELERLTTKREQVYKKIGHYVQLREQLELVKGAGRDFDGRVKVNLGSEFYAQAQIDDMSRVYVDVGQGFHVEFTVPEAMDFTKVKEASLRTQAETLSNDAARVKAHMALVWEGIQEIIASK